MSRPRARQARAVLVAALAALAVAVVGGTLTDLGPWYQALRKPAWQPPDAAFGLIWTTIFALSAVCGVVAWRRAPSASTREWLLGLFAMNGFLNVFWSLLFFRFKRPDWALTEVVAFWLSIALLMVFVGRFSRLGALLLAPYLIWVTVAAALNFEVARLNAPFG